MNEFGITDSHLHIIRSIFKQYQAINKVLIYGSRAKGNYSERSDVDLVICDTTLDRKTIGKILLAINNSDFPYTVDLQIMENIKNKNLQEHIKLSPPTSFLSQNKKTVETPQPSD